MTHSTDYNELTGRNAGFISPEEQEKIRNAAVLVAGCGLGSVIATLAARTGFTRFILADGDSVETSNLNRQAFSREHLGMNKAEATAKQIRDINPSAEIECIPSFITEETAEGLVDRADLIVNMVDPGPVLFTINRAAQNSNKLVFQPFDAGFGGIVLVFSAGSATLEDMLGEEVPPEMLFIRLLEKTFPYIPYLPRYMEKLMPVLNDIITGTRPAPQLGAATYINASLVVTAMVKGALGISLKLAPEPIFLDAWYDIHNGQGGD